MKTYGVPYKGSKSRIAEKLSVAIPTYGIDNFYDIFAGGCAVTHRMLLTGNYKRYYVNDLDGQGVQLFSDAINGKYTDEKRWISREDFYKLKDEDPYISICWSFGNNQRDYMYSKEIEPYKKALHYAVVYNDLSLLCGISDKFECVQNLLRGIKGDMDRQTKVMRVLKAIGEDCNMEWLLRLRRLQGLQCLRRLQGLQCLRRLQGLDYRSVKVKPNSIVYCDIPYIGTNTYSKESSTRQPFNHEEFYDWCEDQKELTLISEYKMPPDRFTAVWQCETKSTMCSRKPKAAIEKLFVPNNQLELYREKMRRLL